MDHDGGLGQRTAYIAVEDYGMHNRLCRSTIKQGLEEHTIQQYLQ